MKSQVRKGELYRLVQNYFSFVRICAKKISHRHFFKFRPLDITNSRNLFPVKIRRVTSVLSTTNDAIAVISFPCFNVLNKFSSFKLLLCCEQWEFTEKAGNVENLLCSNGGLTLQMSAFQNSLLQCIYLSQILTNSQPSVPQHSGQT